MDKAAQLTVKGDAVFDLQGDCATIVAKTASLNALKITLEAQSKITLKVGGSFIVVDPCGVFISGPMVQINSGGSPDSTSDSDVTDPADAARADPGEPDNFLDLQPKGGSGERRHHTAHAKHGFVCTANADGTIQVTKSIRVDAKDPHYADAVIADLSLINSTKNGKALLDGMDTRGKSVLVRELSPPPNPPNAFATPTNGTAAANGTGSDSNVDYNPDQWPDPSTRLSRLAMSFSLHELTHADHNAAGTSDSTPRADNFTTTRNSIPLGRKTSTAMSAVIRAATIITTCSALAATPMRPKALTMDTTTTEQTQALDVTLECQPTRIGKQLSFMYEVTNHSSADLYVMDAVPSVDPSTRQAAADRASVVVYLMGDGHAHVLKGIAPLPTDRTVTLRIIPLAVKVAAGATLKRELRVPLPLAEANPYFPDLPLRQYELVDIPGVLFSVEFLRSTTDGFSAEPVNFAPDLYRVSARNTVGMTERVSRSFPTQRLSIMKRPDTFPRTD